MRMFFSIRSVALIIDKLMEEKGKIYKMYQDTDLTKQTQKL